MLCTGWLTLARSAWAPFDQEFAAFQAAIENLARDVKEEIELASNQAAEIERKAQQLQRKDIYDLLVEIISLHATTCCSNKNAGRVRKLSALRSHMNIDRVTDKKKIQLLDKLSSYDHTTAFRQARSKRCSETAQWLTEERELKQWMSTKDSSTLVLYGKRKRIL